MNRTSSTGAPLENRRSSASGVTLAELMVAMSILTLVALGILTSMVQLRKQGEVIIYQILAQATAEGLMEQIRRSSYIDLSDVTNHPPVELMFISANADNRANVETIMQRWHTDATTFDEVGALSDPADPASPLLGVLMDVDYTDASGNLIRRRRYMKMKINLTHTVNANKDAVQIVLRYQWQVPDRKGADGTGVYYAQREVRSVVSKMPTY